MRKRVIGTLIALALVLALMPAAAVSAGTAGMYGFAGNIKITKAGIHRYVYRSGAGYTQEDELKAGAVISYTGVADGGWCSTADGYSIPLYDGNSYRSGIEKYTGGFPDTGCYQIGVNGAAGYAKPISSSSKVKQYACWTYVDVSSACYNTAGNAWGKTADGCWIYLGDAAKHTHAVSGKTLGLTTYEPKDASSHYVHFQDGDERCVCGKVMVKGQLTTTTEPHNFSGDVCVDCGYRRSGGAAYGTPTLSISGQTAPTALKAGDIFVLYGTISTDCGTITSVTGTISASGGAAVQTKTAAPYAATYDLHGVIDANMEFNKLQTGNYIYSVTATAVNGDKSSTKTLIYQAFTVGSPAAAQSPAVTAGVSSLALDVYSSKTATVTFTVSGNVPAEHYLSCTKSGLSAAVKWGEWSGRSCPMTITADAACSGTLTVYLMDTATKTELASVTVPVRITDSTPQKPALSISVHDTTADMRKTDNMVIKAASTGTSGGNYTFKADYYGPIGNCEWIGSDFSFSFTGTGVAVITISLFNKDTNSVVASEKCTVRIIDSGVSYPDEFGRFGRERSYDGRFSDVGDGQWYTDGVTAAYEMGLMRGSSDSFFNRQGDVTVAEAITMAARMHSIFTTGSEDFSQSGSAWYSEYVSYARANGIIDMDYGKALLMRPISREFFADIFARALPEKAFPELNKIADGSIPDVSESDSYGAPVYSLYRAGVLTGSDEAGTFNPADSITRAEAAAIVTRMADPDMRVSFSL